MSRSQGFAPTGNAPPKTDDKPGGGGDGGGGTTLDLDPLLMALLQKIPSKQEGWPEAKRIRWFRTFAMNVSQIYDGDDDVVELKIEKAKPSDPASGGK